MSKCIIMERFMWFILVLVVIPHLVCTDDDISGRNDDFFDMATKHSIYYDIKSKSPLKVELDDSNRYPTNSVKFVSRGLPCSCQHLTCGCCAGMNITVFNFNRHACMNFTMVPEEFAMDIRLMIDEKEMFKNRLSGRNPPAVCMPLYPLPVINLCVRFFDIGIIDSTLRTCMDFETKVAQWPVFILHFDCIQLGGSGITWVRPNATANFAQPTVADVDIFDHVAFEPADLEITNTTSGLTAEEEDKIGTLKL